MVKNEMLTGWKRLFVLFFTLSFILIGLNVVFAEDDGEKAPTQSTLQTEVKARTGNQYVDANNDGLCDNRGADTGNRGRQGVRNNTGSRFIDEDGDGLCDNQDNRRSGPQDGTGYKRGNRNDQKANDAGPGSRGNRGHRHANCRR